MKARALSFNKRACTTYRPIRRSPRGQIDGVITESGSVFLREMAASGRGMIISANKREILDLLPYRPYAVEVGGTPHGNFACMRTRSPRIENEYAGASRTVRRVKGSANTSESFIEVI